MDLKIKHSASHTENLASIDNPLIAENTAFLRALQANTHEGIHSTFGDAIESLKVSLAADISILESRTIDISSL